jgi:hypothetical protein
MEIRFIDQKGRLDNAMAHEGACEKGTGWPMARAMQLKIAPSFMQRTDHAS